MAAKDYKKQRAPEVLLFLSTMERLVNSLRCFVSHRTQDNEQDTVDYLVEVLLVAWFDPSLWVFIKNDSYIRDKLLALASDPGAYADLWSYQTEVTDLALTIHNSPSPSVGHAPHSDYFGMDIDRAGLAADYGIHNDLALTLDEPYVPLPVREVLVDRCFSQAVGHLGSCGSRPPCPHAWPIYWQNPGPVALNPRVAWEPVDVAIAPTTIDLDSYLASFNPYLLANWRRLRSAFAGSWTHVAVAGTSMERLQQGLVQWADHAKIPQNFWILFTHRETKLVHLTVPDNFYKAFMDCIEQRIASFPWRSTDIRRHVLTTLVTDDLTEKEQLAEHATQLDKLLALMDTRTWRSGLERGNSWLIIVGYLLIDRPRTWNSGYYAKIRPALESLLKTNVFLKLVAPWITSDSDLMTPQEILQGTTPLRYLYRWILGDMCGGSAIPVNFKVMFLLALSSNVSDQFSFFLHDELGLAAKYPGPEVPRSSDPWLDLVNMVRVPGRPGRVYLPRGEFASGASVLINNKISRPTTEQVSFRQFTGDLRLPYALATGSNALTCWDSDRIVPSEETFVVRSTHRICGVCL